MSAKKTTVHAAAAGHGGHGAHGHGGHGEINHETSDARVKPLIWGIVATFVVLAFSYALITGMMAASGLAFNDESVSNYIAATPGPDVQVPPYPRLEQNPKAFGDAYMEKTSAILESYGVDAATGKVHIPIERAMELIVERGIDAAAPAP